MLLFGFRTLESGARYI